jgi:multiple antibiotic resistance protein
MSETIGVWSSDPHSRQRSTSFEHSVYVRFSLLALSSIFFLVDPFAALPTFLAITEGADAARRKQHCAEGVR